MGTGLASGPDAPRRRPSRPLPAAAGRPVHSGRSGHPDQHRHLGRQRLAGGSGRSLLVSSTRKRTRTPPSSSAWPGTRNWATISASRSSPPASAKWPGSSRPSPAPGWRDPPGLPGRGGPEVRFYDRPTAERQERQPVERKAPKHTERIRAAPVHTSTKASSWTRRTWSGRRSCGERAIDRRSGRDGWS
jgi:hypothetical protein